MREILFRGKRKIDNRWIEGDFITDEQELSKAYIGYLFGVDDDGTVHDTDVTEVDPETVCQWTGLTDKKGRKIFEGDIVKVLYTNGQEDGGDVTEVKYSEKSASFSPWDWEYDCDGCDLYFHIKEIEIVGNAFDKE